jgi:hypothetical protein
MNATISTLRPDRPTPETPAPPRPGGFVSDALISLAIFAAFAALFVGCSARAPLWGDSAKLSIFVLDNDYGKRRLTSGMGHHTLTVAGGRLVADIAGLPPHRGLAVLSALCGAGSAALLFLLLRGYGLSQAVGLFCAAAFAMAHMNLFAFTVQESYAPMMVLWLGMLLCFQALRRTPSPVVSLVCGALVGLSVANHSLSVMLYGIVLFPALVLRHGLRRSAAPTLFGLIGFAAAFGPIYFLLMTPPDASVALDQEIGSAFASWVNYRSLPKGLVFFALWTGLQLPLVWLVIGVNVRQWRRPIVADIGPHLAVIAVTAVFTSMYIIQRRMLMMTIALPSILVLAAAAIDTLGLSSKSLRRLAPAAVVFNLVLYSAVAAVMGPLVTKIVPELRVNHWRPADYYFEPFAHLDDHAGKLRDELERLIPASPADGRKTIVVSDFTFVQPLMYWQKWNGWRPDFELVDTGAWYSEDDARIARRVADLLARAVAEDARVVVLPYPDRFLSRLRLESVADVYYLHDLAIVNPKAEAFPPPE